MEKNNFFKLIFVVIILMLADINPASGVAPSLIDAIDVPLQLPNSKLGLCNKHRRLFSKLYGNQITLVAFPTYELQIGNTIYHYCPFCVSEIIHKLLKKKGIKPLKEEVIE